MTLLHQFLLILLLVAREAVVAFNVDLVEPLLLQPPSQSGIHFGFSIAHFTNGTEPRLLVGAPLANTTQDVARPGALYSCVLDGSSSPACSQLVVDTRMDQDDKYVSWIAKDLKDDQRLGFSLAANQNNIVVCAPRWHGQNTLIGGKETDFPVGICFAASAPNYIFTAFSPAYDVSESNLSRLSYLADGSCQVGMSAALVKGKESVALGSPGCWTWQGDTWEVDLSSIKDKTTFRRASPNKTTLGPGDMSYGYLGYSVASMTFLDQPAVVSAMPKPNNLRETGESVKGPVVLIVKEDERDANKLQVLEKLEPPMNKTSGQASRASDSTVFSYFGYSVAAVDVNGDGLDDVIVGAPLYHNGSHYDQGAVFVYMQRKEDFGGDSITTATMRLEDGAPRRMGQESYGRFGSSVASVGDLDGDGYQDVAVGAPFMEDGGRVFIYRGSGKGLEDEPSQVIRASELPSSGPLSGFGFTIAQNLPDTALGVGVLYSDKVLVFSTKEIVHVEWGFKSLSSIDLTDQGCEWEDATHPLGKYPCVDGIMCVRYTIANPKDAPTDVLDFIVLMEADVKYQQKRLFFENGLAEKNITIRATKDGEACMEEKVMAQNDLHDIKPFAIRARLAPSNLPTRGVMMGPSVMSQKDWELPILVKCEGGVTDECQSDLDLEYKVVNHFTVSSSSVVVNFTITNHGDPAYYTRITIDSHGDLGNPVASDGVTCDTPDDIIKCEIAAIFDKDTTKTFSVTMDPQKSFYDYETQRTHDNFFLLDAALETTSSQVDPDTSKKTFQVPIEVDMSLDLTKEPSIPDIVHYNSSNYFKQPGAATTEGELGPEVKHVYKIYNKNEYLVFRTRVEIKWPLKLNGMYLLYLLGQPHFSDGNPNCEYSGGEVDEYQLAGKLEDGSIGNFSRAPDFSAVHSRMKNDQSVDYLQFSCVLGELSQSQEIVITLRSRLVQTTLQTQTLGKPLDDVASEMVYQILQLPWGMPAHPASSPRSVVTPISYKFGAPGEIPWWVYLAAALGGLLILLIIVLALWKCGFFKRFKPQQDTADGAEKEALNEAEDDEEEGEPGTPITPESAMLKQTEKANDDFTYSKPQPPV